MGIVGEQTPKQRIENKENGEYVAEHTIVEIRWDTTILYSWIIGWINYFCMSNLFIQTNVFKYG